MRSGHRSAPCRVAVALLVVVVCWACASTPRQGNAPPTEDGIYEFITRTGERGELRGTLTVLAGEMSLAPEQGGCRHDAAFVSQERLRFICDNTSEVENLALVLDRWYPLTRSTWTGSVRQRRTRQVCVQYATQNGRQVCVRTQTETYEVRTSVSGPLTFRRRVSG